MTPAARLQAAIDLLEAIEDTDAPADRSIAAFLRDRRYIGSGDRREVVERVYAVLRRRARLVWWIAKAGAAAPGARTRVIAALMLVEGWSVDHLSGSFDGGRYRPRPLEEGERALARALQGWTLADPAQPRTVRLEYPAWLEPRLALSFGDRLEPEMAALAAEAPLDLRVNLLKAEREEAKAALAAAGVQATETPLSPWGLRVPARLALAGLDLFRMGLVEVQDEGSQLIALLTDARPGVRVCDFCAGAGGKTLALAAVMANRGHIVACDVLPGRLDRSAVRLKRAGIHNVRPQTLGDERDPWIKRHRESFERVLVDAPCTGIGTWRRNPDAKWRLTPERIADLAELQGRILAAAARLVAPGGRLVYATCSLLPEENEDQVQRFLHSQPRFAPVPAAEVWAAVSPVPYPGVGTMLTLTPAGHGTDGFFVCVLAREAAA